MNRKVETWIEDAEKLFSFAVKAKTEFLKGNLERRKDIMSAFGFEHVLNQGVVSIKIEKPFLIIQEMVFLLEGSREKY